MYTIKRMSNIKAGCKTMTQTNSAPGMSVKMTYTNHAYKHSECYTKLMHQKTALTSLHISDTHATLCLKQ
jgi:hypothetical protein